MYINGRNAVLEALRSGERVEKVFILFGMEGEPIARIKNAAKEARVQCVTIDKQRYLQLERNAGFTTRSQGVVALLSVVEYADIEAVVEETYRLGKTPLIAAMDGITDPHNVGAIIRSAECAGVDGVVIAMRDSSGITDVVMKTSAGAANHIPIARVASISATVKRLQQAGLTAVGLAGEATESYTMYDFTIPTVLIIGSEGKGMSQRLTDQCDHLLSIPMSGNIESLNASVASGVVFFEARRQRG